MREKIARAMCVADGYSNPDAPFSGNKNRHPWWELYVPAAAAALDALMEPTQQMYDAATGIEVNCYLDASAGVHPDQWKAMIRAAKEGK